MCDCWPLSSNLFPAALFFLSDIGNANVLDAGLEIFCMRPPSKAQLQQHLEQEIVASSFELSMHGMPILLPHMSDRVLLMEPSEMMQLLLHTELPLTDLSNSTQEQCSDMSLGSMAIICDEVSGALSASHYPQCGTESGS
jgi:hypothetical protein